jgi:site-specific recombinase XerD
MICASLYRAVFIKNLLRYLAEKILLLNTTNFRGDYHSGRRTYITRLANKGVGVRLLAALAGHSHISNTQRYIDVNADQMKEAVELL